MAQMKAELNETWFACSGPTPAQLEAMSLRTIAFRVRTSSLNTHRRTTSPPTTCTQSVAIRNVETPVDTIVNGFARHALWIAITLLLVSFAFRFLPGALSQRAMTTEMTQFVE
jgi:hypothetical protein